MFLFLLLLFFVFVFVFVFLVVVVAVVVVTFAFFLRHVVVEDRQISCLFALIASRGGKNIINTDVFFASDAPNHGV